MSAKSNTKKNGNRRKGGKFATNPTRHGNNSSDAKSTEDMARNSTNDPSWYATNPQLLKDAASYPFSHAAGTRIPMSLNTHATGYNDYQTVSGIANMKLVPTVGYSNNNASPINVAGVRMYSYVRHANSGHSNYDAVDLTLYVTAMAQVYSFLNWCMRLYGCASLYSHRNRYMPRAIVEAQGIDYDDLTSNLADFRFWINVYIERAASLAVPADMSYFTRLAFVYQNIYIEGPSVKDQLYMFSPAGFHFFEWDAATSMGKLKFKKWTGDPYNKKTIAELKDYGSQLLESILYDEDMNIMSGDVLKAYGSNIIKLQTLPELYPIVPIYDPMVLTQFKNATPLRLENLDIVQDESAGYLVHTPTVFEYLSYQALSNYFRGNTVISVDAEDVSPEMMMEATRLTMGFAASGNSKVYPDCGSELPVGVDYIYLDRTGASQFVTMYNLRADLSEDINTQGASVVLSNILDEISRREHFKYAPAVHYYLDDKPLAHVNELDNYAVLDGHDLSKLHEAARMNMLAVPSIAKVSNN